MRKNGSSNGKAHSTLSHLELRSPPLPHTLVEAMDLINNPDQLEMDPVTTMVERDPIVVARLLQIVNSAYYGLQRSIDSVDRAVVMLGPVAVTGIVMGMNMLKLRNALEGPAARSFVKLIRHCIATAFLTRHIAEGPPRAYPDHTRQQARRIGASFTVGLLHDFGKIILVYNFPREAVELYERQTVADQVTSTDLRELEQLLFGFDHTEAGEYVARKLDFPDALTDVIRYHHDLDRTSENCETDRLIRATAAANTASKALGFAFTNSIRWETCTSDPIWDKILTPEFPQYQSAEMLFDDLRAQHDQLHEYVQNLTGATLSSIADKPAAQHTKNDA